MNHACDEGDFEVLEDLQTSMHFVVKDILGRVKRLPITLIAI
jgi:hypothetical protein